MICKRCKSTIPDTAKFCPKCGAKVEVTEAFVEVQKQGMNICPKCGTLYPLSAKFCKNDGTPLQSISPTTAEAKKPEVMEEEVKTREVIICPKCKTTYPITAKFCRKDGTPLKKEIATERVIEKKPKEVALPKARKTPVWIALSAFIIIFFGAVSYLYFSGKIGKKPAEITAVPNVTKPPQTMKASEKVEKPTAPQKLETEVVSPQEPTSEPFKPSIDIEEIEIELNSALRDKGLINVYAEVSEDLTATLKGTVNDPRDKEYAIIVAKKFRELKEIRDNIRVATSPSEEMQERIKIPVSKVEIQKALRDAGFVDIEVEVEEDFTVNLKGSVKSIEEKERILKVVKGIKGVKKIKDMIFVIG